MRDSDWLTLALIIVNFNHFFIQPAPGGKRNLKMNINAHQAIFLYECI